jgi:DNA modification methylase
MRCYGIEIDPLYVDTPIRRWQTYRGDEAIHTASKKTFAQVATGRIATND